MPLQRVLPDGACCFRALAAAVIHGFVGINCGGGSPTGSEKTLGDVVANAGAAWLRFLSVGALCSSEGGRHALGDTFGPQRRSMLGMLIEARKRLLRHGRSSTKNIDAHRRALQAPDVFVGVCAPARELPNGLLAEQLVEISGHLTFRRYCEAMLMPRTWAGAPELYAAATLVLRLPVTVYASVSDAVQTFWPPEDGGADAPLHFVLVYAHRHYDAVLPDVPTVPLLDSGPGAGRDKKGTAPRPASREQ